jgi:site-specific DNA-adenine methylase
MKDGPKITALAPWYGSNRLNAHRVGELLDGCEWVGVPFAGGMCEIPHITARTIMVNDLHKGIFSLARSVASPTKLDSLMRALRKQAFHPDTLAAAQRNHFPDSPIKGAFAEHNRAMTYFIVAWMTRSGTAGTNGEKTGKLALRWEAGGGDSVKRYHSAIDSLPEWSKHFQRCQFSCLDAFEFLDKCKDQAKHGIYCDPPFLGKPGMTYTHSGGETLADQDVWHFELALRLEQFSKTRIVVRAYDTPDVRELYTQPFWTWHTFEGRKQTNDSAPEVLICN